MNRSPWLPALVLALGLAAMGTAHAMQDEDAADEEESDDVITIYGDGRRDKGMEAFMAGDYEQAEIEFELNLECAERERLLQDTMLEMVTEEGEFQFFPPQRSTTSTGADGFGDRTCENSPWQLYMIAMSQIQQGKYAEAKRNFYRVINTSRDPLLFDAHYRIALLEILDGNYDKAEDRLKTLIVLQERCHRRDDRCEFRDEIDELVAYLGPALERARSEAVEG